jgi:hypothetical protein
MHPANEDLGMFSPLGIQSGNDLPIQPWAENHENHSAIRNSWMVGFQNGPTLGWLL